MCRLWLFMRFAGQSTASSRTAAPLVTRIAGLLLSAIAVQLVADSVRAFVSAGA